MGEDGSEVEELDTISDTFTMTMDDELSSNEVSHENLKPIAQKYRKNIKMYRRSPLKAENLQMKNDFKVELGIKLDSKTRWSSAFSMT